MSFIGTLLGCSRRRAHDPNPISNALSAPSLTSRVTHAVFSRIKQIFGFKEKTAISPETERLTDRHHITPAPVRKTTPEELEQALIQASKGGDASLAAFLSHLPSDSSLSSSNLGNALLMTSDPKAVARLLQFSQEHQIPIPLPCLGEALFLASGSNYKIVALLLGFFEHTHTPIPPDALGKAIMKASQWGKYALISLFRNLPAGSTISPADLGEALFSAASQEKEAVTQLLQFSKKAGIEIPPEKLEEAFFRAVSNFRGLDVARAYLPAFGKEALERALAKATGEAASILQDV